MKREPKAHYLSLNDALYDDTQPAFDPRQLHSGVSTPSGDESFAKPLPSPSLFPRGLPRPPEQHPFAEGFEAPIWTHLLIHVGLCLVAYPLLIIFTVIARNKSLFWTRFIVSMGCGLIGLSLGLSLLRLGKRFLESASEWCDVAF
jgi:hypothetical protein